MHKELEAYEAFTARKLGRREGSLGDEFGDPYQSVYTFFWTLLPNALVARKRTPEAGGSRFPKVEAMVCTSIYNTGQEVSL